MLEHDLLVQRNSTIWLANAELSQCGTADAVNER